MIGMFGLQPTIDQFGLGTDGPAVIMTNLLLALESVDSDPTGTLAELESTPGSP